MGLDIDWNASAQELKAAFKTAFRSILRGAEKDLEEFYSELATDLTAAIRVGRQDLVNEIKEQAKVRAEHRRIMSTNRGWEIVAMTVDVSSRLAVKIVKETIPLLALVPESAPAAQVATAEERTPGEPA